MQHTIQQISNKTFENRETKQTITLPGFSYHDKYGHCMIIVYGISNYNQMNKLLK